VKHVALLRGINVGGHKPIGMSELRDLLESLGFAGVKSLLQSGNLVFECARLTGAALEQLLESETAARLEVSADYVVRTAAEWERLIAGNPFPDEAKRDPGHLVVMFLKTAPPARELKTLQAAIRGPETIGWIGKQLYIVYPEGIGRSKLTNTLIERTLGIRGTGRNWNTVIKLAAMVRE
jgi:uncharacterized protein (DUF1697 family)